MDQHRVSSIKSKPNTKSNKRLNKPLEKDDIEINLSKKFSQLTVRRLTGDTSGSGKKSTDLENNSLEEQNYRKLKKSKKTLNSQNQSIPSSYSSINEVVLRRSRYQNPNLLKWQCSSLRSSNSSIVSNEDAVHAFPPGNRINHHQGSNRSKSRYLRSSSSEPRRTNHRKNSITLPDFTNLISDDELDNPKRNYDRRQSLLKSQCSSVCSSTSSIFSVESNISERRRYDRPNKFQNTHNNGSYFTNHYMQNLISKNDDLFKKALLRNQEGFEKIFCTPKAVKDMSIIFELLARIGKLNDEFTKDYLLSQSLNLEFIENISDYLSCILLGSSIDLTKKLETLQNFYFNIINMIPPENLKVFTELFTDSLSKMEKIANVPKFIFDNMHELLKLISEKLEYHESQLNVTNLSVLPSAQDLSEYPELQPNKVKGPYESPLHYLITHFKLYKEDFVSGLRQGLEEFEEYKKENFKRFKNIFLYEAVYCGLVKTNNNKNFSFGFEINNKKIKKVDWATSKRLLHGSLLLISNDMFKTYYYALLDEKETPKGEKKSFNISAILVDKIIKFKKYTECIIIEPRVFFTPYFQVLKTFKKIEANMFPMESYIIKVNIEANPPAYLNDEKHYLINGNEINIQHLQSMDNPENLGLNKSQITALEASLIKEFVIIQGPPGTGKSYLGLKIINILLDNKLKWRRGYAPILIICYRNNAVDQILESLINDGRSVVRLGGQSSNTLVKETCLRAAVKQVRANPGIQVQIDTLKGEINKTKAKISELQLVVNFISDRKGILCPEALREVLTEQQNCYFLDSNVYEDWLLGGSHENDDLLDNEQIFEDLLFEEQFKNRFELSELRGSILLLNVYDLKEEILDIRNRIGQTLDNCVEYSRAEIHSNIPNNNLSCLIVELLQKLEEKEMFLKKFINRMNLKTEEFIDPSYLNKNELSALSLSERWKLYEYWTSEYSALCSKKIEELFLFINEKLDSLDDVYGKSDGYKICSLQPDVIGATTTGAARLYSLMNVIKPKIVVFEEAAEVLEAHSITALTQFCQHLIMIGDHQQLRPNPSNITSVLKYKLDVSLFERMINNGMEYFPLNEQHRMRPLISSLVIPQFYPHLGNHPSVENYPDIKGLRENMFFLDHTIPEDELTDTESHRNKHEARFALALTDYLLKQGYEKKDITVLTMYGAQLLYLKALSKENSSLKDVSIEVVDNFQGEENKIIILSLVRSNPYSIGFLSKMNRICVALTRAREGFYLIGNMSTLKGNSVVWKGIYDTLKKHNNIGNELPLKCVTHQTITWVQSSVDFVPLKFGGCTLKCGSKLECGHICDQQCHGSDENHMVKFTCKKPCERKRNCNIHDCEAACGEQCPKCDVKLESELPCGHIGLKVCDGDFLPCDSKCKDPLPCGHPCTKECHFPSDHSTDVCRFPCGRPNKNCPIGHKCVKPCGQECGDCEVKTFINLPCGHAAKQKCSAPIKICKVPVEKDLDCGHTVELECYKPISEIKCMKKKPKLLECGHEIEISCSPEQLNEKELLCKHKVKKVLLCGHIKKIKCYLSNDENLFCNELVRRKLDCEHGFKMEKCSTPSDEILCIENVLKTADCGHETEILCHEKSQRIICKQPCNLIKSCGHKCSGFCGEPCPDCQELVESVVKICGHKEEISCSTLNDSLTNNVAFEMEESIGKTDCNALCESKLECGHLCKGTCGSCMQGRVHELCLAKCSHLLLCGHKCASSCNSSIHLCTQKCLNKCKHQSCRKMCCQACDKCKMPCSWKCEHFECTRLCWEECNRPPCAAPCKKSLSCGHSCNGFCGEPCPHICFTCSNNQGNDRYILLEDCHHEISHNDISILLKSNIGLFLCPICQTPQTTSNYIRFFSKHWFDILRRIKNRISTEYNNVRCLTYDLKGSINRICAVLKTNMDGMKEASLLLDDIVRRSTVIFCQQNKYHDTESLRSLVFVSYYICEAFFFLKESNQSNNKHLLSRINHIAYYLRLQRAGISGDQMYQFNDELLRLSILCSLSKIKESSNTLSADPLKKEYFEQAWKLACVMKEFNDEEKTPIVLSVEKLNSHVPIMTSLPQSKFLHIFEKYQQLSLHKKSWMKCKYKSHVIFKYRTASKQPDCPTCMNKREFFF